MKLTIIVFFISLISFQGCKKGDDNNAKQAVPQKKVENWANFDDEVDVKSEAVIDTVKFRKEIDKILPPEKIVQLFGSGYHNFYLGLTISKESEVQFTLGTNISFWLNPSADVKDLIFREGVDYNSLFKEYKVHASNTAVKQKKDAENNSVNQTYKVHALKNQSKIENNNNYTIFENPFTDVNKIFTAKPGIMNGNPVRTIKLYEIAVFVSADGRIIKPWSVRDIELSKYREHLYEPNVNRFYFMTGLPAVCLDGFESMRKQIVYPQEALRNGITGRVIVELFAGVNGELEGYQLLKGLGYGCDEAVLNAIKNSKFKANPTGQRSCIIVPFEFGPPQSTPIDLAVQLFDYNPDTSVYNNIRMQIVNKNQMDKNINLNYFIYVYINNYCVFQTYCPVVSKTSLQQFYWFRWRPNKPGSYNYAIYIDPENRLNDSNRENNTVKGTLVVH
ncbi:MAG: TonB family protein [Ignavibacteriaceae bacterium]|nr:TonB family protein [Ignavibacteriaceae bacterium]